MVIVFRHQARAELSQPFQLSPDRITSQVEMDAVLHDLLLWHQLEENPWLHARPLDEDVRVVLRIKNSLTVQPGKFCLIVRSNLITVEGGGPEPGD